MKNNERFQDILGLLYANGRVSVAELAKELYVSEMTIRRDLIEMENGGYVKRYRGGAVLKSDQREMPINEREFVDREEKKLLCAKCEKYLRNNITVFLDSSSTCLYLIAYLKNYKGILLVTNSVKALNNAAPYHIPTILIGGEYYEQDMCMIGPLAEEYARDINIDIAFMTTAAYSCDGVVSDFDLKQTSVRKNIMLNAKQTVFMFEKNKLGKKLTYTLCRKEDVTEVIMVD